MALSVKGTLPKGGRNTGLGGGRLKRTVVALALMVCLGVALALLNALATRRDLALATGPESQAQREWLVAAAERPDIAGFFKNLPHERRVAMAAAIARYDDAPLAKLSGILLADFDAEARARLVLGLKRVAAVHPEAVADGLKQKGSFQQLGVFEALRSQGERSIPGVVAMLDNGDARPAAVAYLVAAGPPAIAPLLPRLADPKPEVRLAAADALGGLRARAAVAPLLKDLESAAPADRPAYLTALAAVGDPSTAPLLAEILQDPARPLAERAAVSLGLGRIAAPATLPLLWRFAASDEPVLANAARAALAVVGPPALARPNVPSVLRLRVAATLAGPEADRTIAEALGHPETRLAAVTAARGRLRLVPALIALLQTAKDDGDLAAALVDALASTEPGRKALVPDRDDPSLMGFIRRSQP